MQKYLNSVYLHFVIKASLWYIGCAILMLKPYNMSPEDKRILIVEDEDALARILQLHIKDVGINVEVAGNGEEALTKIEKTKFDLIILDLLMPRVNGFEVLKQLKEKKYEIPVFIATNLGNTEDIKKVESLGVKHYFVKSNTPIDVLVDHIKDFLDITQS